MIKTDAAFSCLSFMSNVFVLGGIFFALLMPAKAQVTDSVYLDVEEGRLYGTLMKPGGVARVPLAILVPGSGPTDRDGNNPMMKNNTLRILADSLLSHGIASLRFDKRGIGESAKAAGSEEELRFETYVHDLVAWIRWSRDSAGFDSIFLLGHSEGALIALLAAGQAKVSGYVSMAGPGRPAGQLIREQIDRQAPLLAEPVGSIIDSLESGWLVKSVHPMLFSLFRPSVQPYLISWFRYDPVVEIRKLSIPVLVVQGTTDIQVDVEDARLLAEAKGIHPVLIDNMNHIFRQAPADRNQNIQTYYESDTPVMSALVIELVRFIYRQKKS